MRFASHVLTKIDDLSFTKNDLLNDIITIGLDIHYRAFIALKYYYNNKNDIKRSNKIKNSETVLYYFQRYTDNKEIWLLGSIYPLLSY